MMNVYHAKVEQMSSTGYLHAKEEFSIRARTMDEAFRRLKVACRKNGFLKSQPIEVVSIERIVEDLK